jgi:hypothetical protein
MNWEERKNRKLPAPSNESKLHSHEAAPYYTEDPSLQDVQDFHTSSSDFSQRRQQDFHSMNDQRSDSRHLQELKEKSVFLESQLHGSRLKLMHIEKENERLQQDLNESSHSKKTSVLELEIESLRSSLDIKTKQCESLEKALKGERNKHLNEMADLKNKLRVINENFLVGNRPVVVNEDMIEINELREENRRLKAKVSCLVQEHEKTVDELKNEMNEQFLYFKQLLEEKQAEENQRADDFNQKEVERKSIEKSNYQTKPIFNETRDTHDQVGFDKLEKRPESGFQSSNTFNENILFESGFKDISSFDTNKKIPKKKQDETPVKNVEFRESTQQGKTIEPPPKLLKKVSDTEASAYSNESLSKKPLSPFKNPEVKPISQVSKELNFRPNPEKNENSSKINQTQPFPLQKKENFQPKPTPSSEPTTFQTIPENPSTISTFFDDLPVKSSEKETSFRESSKISDFFSEKEEKPEKTGEIFSFFDKPSGFFTENDEKVSKLFDSENDLNFENPIQQFFSHGQEPKANLFETPEIDENEEEPQEVELNENDEKNEICGLTWNQTDPDFAQFNNLTSPDDFFSRIKPSGDYQTIPSSLFDF